MALSFLPSHLKKAREDHLYATEWMEHVSGLECGAEVVVFEGRTNRYLMTRRRSSAVQARLRLAVQAVGEKKEGWAKAVEIYLVVLPVFC